MEPDKAPDKNPICLAVSSTLSSILNGGEGRGEEAVNLTSELLPPDMMMPEAFQPLAGG